MKARKKPVLVEVEQWHPTGSCPKGQDQYGGCGCGGTTSLPDYVETRLTGSGLHLGWIETLEGGHIVTPGDWIITGVQGEKYPCKPGIFEKTYELVN